MQAVAFSASRKNKFYVEYWFKCCWNVIGQNLNKIIWMSESDITINIIFLVEKINTRNKDKNNRLSHFHMNILAEQVNNKQACFFISSECSYVWSLRWALSVAFVRNKILYFSRAQAYSSLFLHSESVKYKCCALYSQK